MFLNSFLISRVNVMCEGEFNKVTIIHITCTKKSRAKIVEFWDDTFAGLLFFMFSHCLACGVNSWIMDLILHSEFHAMNSHTRPWIWFQTILMPRFYLFSSSTTTSLSPTHNLSSSLALPLTLSILLFSHIRLYTEFYSATYSHSRSSLIA